MPVLCCRALQGKGWGDLPQINLVKLFFTGWIISVSAFVSSDPLMKATLQPAGSWINRADAAEHDGFQHSVQTFESQKKKKKKERSGEKGAKIGCLKLSRLVCSVSDEQWDSMMIPNGSSGEVCPGTGFSWKLLIQWSQHKFIVTLPPPGNDVHVLISSTHFLWLYMLM